MEKNYNLFPQVISEQSRARGSSNTTIPNWCVAFIKKQSVLWMVLMCIMCMVSAHAQNVSQYTFSQTLGTYAPVTGTVVHAAGWDDIPATVPIGFSFLFNNVAYSSVSVNPNGYISFGTNTTNSYTPISATTAYGGVIAAFVRDLISNGSTIVSEVIGSAPNRTLVIQWNNAARYNSFSVPAVPGDALNFQIRLNETSNSVDVVYGTLASTSTTSTVQVGLRGASNTVYNNRTATTTWSPTTAGTSNTSTVTYSNTIAPASGLTLSWAIPTTPFINTGAISAAFGNVCINTTSVARNFTLSGSNLTSDVTVGALNGYSYSTTETGTYTPTLTLSPVSGSIAQTVYVTLTPTAVQSYSGNIPVTGGGTTGTTNVAVTGAGINTAPSLTNNGAPSAATTALVTISGSTISNIGCSVVTGYGIEYSTTPAFANGTGTQVAGTGFSGTSGGTFSAAISGLSANTTYYYRAYATNSIGTTYFTTPSSFVSPQVSAALPYTENFEGTVEYNLLNAAYTNKWVVGSALNNGGTKSLYVSNDNGTTNAYTLNSASVVQAFRDITIPAGTTVASFSFNWKGYGESASFDYLRVWLVPVNYTPTPGTRIAATTGFVQVGGNFNLQNAWQTYTNTSLNVSSFAGASMRLVFEWYNDGSGGTQPPAAVDNVSLFVPECLVPTAVIASATATTTATLSWTAPTPAPANGYQYEVRASGAAGSGATGLIASGSSTAVTASVTGLTANTIYTVYVRSFCGGSSYSAWTSGTSFSTPCSSVGVPYYQDFESATVPALPSCTSSQNAGTGNNWTTSGTAGSGFTSKTLTYGFNTSAPANAWFYTNGINLTTGTSYTISYRYGNNSTSYTESLRVAYGTTAVNTAMTTVLATHASVTGAVPVTNSVVFTAPATGTYYFGFNAYSVSNQWNLYVDDIAVIVTPTCLVPTAVTGAATTFSTANISFTASTSAPVNGYEYEVRTTGAAGSGASGLSASGTIPAGSTTAAITGLTQTTNYSVYVRAHCDGTDFSAWTSAATFSTPASCLVPTAFTSSLTATTATVSWTASASAPSGGYEFELRTSGAVGSGATGFVTSGIETGVSHSFSGLTSSTAYTLYVRSSCGGGDFSAWASRVFTTRLVNDDFADALPIACDATYTGSTTPATNDQPNPAIYGVNNQLSPNVWYKYTGTGAAQQVTLSLCGSGYDTAVLVATGTAGNLTYIAGNDDSATGCPIATTRSQVIFNSDGTTTYYIMIRGWQAGTTGTYSMVVSCAALCTPIANNDECANAEVITLGSALATNNTCATPSTQAYPSCGSQYSSYFDTWYTVDSGSNTILQVSTVATSPAVVGYAVYTGTCAGTLTQISCVLTGVPTNITVTANTVYYIRAYSNGAAARGDFSLLVKVPCMAPIAVTPVATSASTATVTWGTPPGLAPAGYEYEIRTSGAGGSGAAGLVSAASTTDTSVSLTGLSADTLYLVYVRTSCGAGENSPWEGNYFSVPYCYPAATYVGDYYITNFSTAGGYTNIANNTGADTSMYVTYPAMNVSQSAGNSVTYSLSVPAYTLAAIWVDWNNDFDFDDADESIASFIDYGFGDTVYTGSITIPAGTALGSYKMRVRSGYAFEDEAGTACSFNYEGQTEDYVVNVTNVPSCFVPVNLTATSVTLTTANFAWAAPAAGPAPVEYEYAVTTSFTNPTTGITATTATSVTGYAGLTENTFYYLHVRTNCGANYSDWSTISFYQGYCIPTPASQDGDGITNVTIGTINNTTGSESGYYGNYSSLITDAAQTSAVNFSVTFSTDGFGYGTKIWVDWNDDLNFSTAELVYTGISASTDPATLTGTFTVPVTAALGNHRLRIGGTDADSGPDIACYTGEYGTFEDYAINVTPAPPCTTATNVAGTIVAPNTVNLSWTAPTAGNTPVGYEYDVTTSATPPESGTPTTDTFVTGYSGLVANTNYYLHVRTNCDLGSYSAWVTSAAFKYVPGDICATAISLDALAGTVSGTTAGAANNFTPSCNTTNTAGDIYYSITVPANYTLVIGQTVNNYDSVHSVFYGSCASPTAIICRDDPDTVTDGATSQVTWRNPTGISQTVYWVQDGYNAVTGTYTLAWTLTPTCYTWTGAVSTVWTAADNWCENTVPSATSDVIIADVTRDPVIDSGTVSVNNLTVNAGAALTVATGATLSVAGTVTTSETGTGITVQNNGALLQPTASATNGNTGKVTVIKNSNPLYRLDYTLWSSPVDGQTLSGFSPETSTGRFYEYGYNAADAREQYNTVDSGITFAPAKGYLIRMPNGNFTVPGYNGGTGAYSYTGTFTGTPRNGDYAIAAAANEGYTAVGNPYPSPISVVDFFTANNGVMNASSGLYFWRKRNNAAASSYATLTLAAYTSNAGYDANPGTSDPENPYIGGGQEQSVFFEGAESAWRISQGQGFFVQTAANPTSTNIVFNNGMREAAPATGSQAFFRTATSTRSRLWLNLTDAQHGRSQVAIAYMDNATLGLDYGYDGAMLNDGGSVVLYSLAENTNLAVQARPAFVTGDVVPMGYIATAAGQFSISIDHTDGVFAQGQEIFIKDNLLGTVTSLDTAYTFVTEAGTFNQRFEVVYTTSALGTDAPQLDANSVIVFKEGNAININTGTASMNGVTIFDIRGRQIYAKAGINAAQTVVSGLQVEQQVLIIEIDTVKGKVSKRIVF